MISKLLSQYLLIAKIKECNWRTFLMMMQRTEFASIVSLCFVLCVLQFCNLTCLHLWKWNGCIQHSKKCYVYMHENAIVGVLRIAWEYHSGCSVVRVGLAVRGWRPSMWCGICFKRQYLQTCLDAMIFWHSYPFIKRCVQFLLWCWILL